MKKLTVVIKGNNIFDAPCAIEDNNSIFDDEEWSSMAWTTPQYKRGQVDRAGSLLASPLDFSNLNTPEEIDAAIQVIDGALSIINNWRSSHSYPLQVLKMTLLTRARKIDGQAVIAQRLKRLSSIASKLRRNRHMKLSQMQDIGGCRAVLGTVRRVDKLVSIYKESIAKNPHGRPECVETYDYIAEPKRDGYRSIHYVYKYRTEAKDLTVYNGLRICIPFFHV